MAIKSSVGKKGKNVKADVIEVQDLLNRATRIPYRLLDTDGFAGAKTIERIEFFQREVMGFQFKVLDEDVIKCISSLPVELDGVDTDPVEVVGHTAPNLTGGARHPPLGRATG